MSSTCNEQYYLWNGPILFFRGFVHLYVQFLLEVLTQINNLFHFHYKSNIMQKRVDGIKFPAIAKPSLF